MPEITDGCRRAAEEIFLQHIGPLMPMRFQTNTDASDSVYEYMGDLGEIIARNTRAVEMEKALRAASHALRSYQYGNDAPGLAEDVAANIDAIIARLEGKS